MATVGERASSVLAAEGPETKKGGGPGRLAARTGMHVPRVFSREGSSPFDEVEWDLRTAEIKDERGRVDLPAGRLRDPSELEPAGHQRRGEQVLLRRRASGNGSPADGKREYSVRQLIHRVTRTIADWGMRRRLFRHRRGCRAVLRRADGPLPEPVRVVQLAGLVQRRPVPPLRHQRPGQQLAMGRGDPDRRARPRAPTNIRRPRPASSRASATTWKTSCGWRPARPCSSSSARAPAPTCRRSARSREKLSGGGKPSGPVSFMRVYDADRRGRQVGRQDPPRRQDADPQVLASRHPRIHRVQDQGREEGPALIRSGLRGQLQRRRLQLGHVPERQPLGPRHRRLPPRRRGRRRLDHPRRHHRPARCRPTRPGCCWTRSPRGPGSAATPACSTRTPSSAGTPARTRRRSIRRIRAREYMFIDDSACNLASINLMKFRREDGEFRRRAVPGGLRGSSSRRRRSWSTTPATRPTGSPRTATSSGRWGWAMPTWAA